MPLPNFLADAVSLCANKCPVQGWQHFSTINRNLKPEKHKILLLAALLA